MHTGSTRQRERVESRSQIYRYGRVIDAISAFFFLYEKPPEAHAQQLPCLCPESALLKSCTHAMQARFDQ